MPIDAGLCTLAECKGLNADGDPILDLVDLCDLNEILIVRAENERRARRASEQQQGRR